MQRSVVLATRSTEIKSEAILDKIIMKLRARDHYRQPVWDLILALDANEKSEKKSNSEKKDSIDLWKEQYTRMTLTPSKLLQHVLSKVNPIVYSAGNFRDMVRQMSTSKREPDPKTLSEHVEFVSNWPTDGLIPPEMRDLDLMTDKIVTALLRPRQWASRQVVVVHGRLGEQRRLL